MVAPGKRGVNRKELINDLQERFQFKDKAEIDAMIAKKRELQMLPDIVPKKKKRRWNMGIA